MTPDAAPSTPLSCPRCAHVIGWVVTRNGAPRLHLPGGLVIRAMTAYCECGHTVRWASSERQLEMLLERMARAD